MRIVFMGTPDFAVGSLQALAEAGKYEIVSVITQPDRPKGRGRQMLMTPVKEYALSQGFEVHQPQRVKTPEFVAQLKEMNPDLIVVAAFGQLLSKEILDMPKYGCINVHASLLPKYRGAAPIHCAIMQGEKDFQATVERDFNAYKQLLSDRDNVEFRLYDNLNHAFVPSVHGNIMLAKQEYGVEQHIGEGVILDIADWIKKTV